ncbi:uncharacterized protein LOC143353835 [Halictus rubicundus]|uniref:uncharacterized protein LOC143353835 n=1 Tax=Halictus rubicundus TaxID=77578 RepID=UPI0040360170
MTSKPAAVDSVDNVFYQQQRECEYLTKFLPNLKKRGENNFTVMYLEQRMALLQETWANIRQLDGFLHASAQDDSERQEHPYFKEKRMDKVNEAYDDTWMYINIHLAKLRPGPNPRLVDNSSVLKSNEPVSQVNYVKLPKVDLPKFDGDYAKWKPFEPRFTSGIVKNAQLSNEVRLQYLFSCLSGKAMSVVEHLDITEENFQIAWDRLKIPQNTVFGWILSGQASDAKLKRPTILAHHMSINDPLETALSKFWESEAIPSCSLLTQEEKHCEQHFADTYTRDDTGRFTVRLPFNKPKPNDFLGDSFRGAVSSLTRLTTKLQNDINVKREYTEFLRQYESLGHMSRLGTVDRTRTYIPHRAVIREESKTTKLRVVFNATNKSSSGYSLNDLLHVGPKLQLDITSILLNWRIHEYVLVADIEKMFRQILVHPSDRRFQCILWKNENTEALEAYELNTITYGTACAPYLAMRVIRELNTLEGADYPLASPVLNNQVYVDDVFIGSPDKKLLEQTRVQVCTLLGRGGFNLRKWAGNDPETLHNIPKYDAFYFSLLQFIPRTDRMTKRELLSEIAKLFDPLGWLSPLVVRAKILMQQQWLEKIGWDDQVSESTQGFMECILYRLACDECEANPAMDPLWTRLVTRISGATYTTLLAAKTRVAPIKTLSIPILELNGALMQNLVPSRCRPSRPFENIGVDYAGPYQVREAVGRGKRAHKTYIAVFICFATHAIHIELVHSYSTEGFLATFDRFISRRGIPATVTSDNGTNFVGAARELARDFVTACQSPELRDRCADLKINWSFYPPGAPLHGGMQEAAVRSVKHHLRRIIGTFTPTAEEMETLLCKVEATLNSRPLTRIRDDADCLEILTPGHFLTGSPLNTRPTSSVADVPISRLTRWRTLQKFHELLWKHWSREYLQELQTRYKWNTEKQQITENDIVLVENPLLPPNRWELGRIIATYPGKDGNTRVVDVRTKSSTYRRPITRICKLPIDE